MLRPKDTATRECRSLNGLWSFAVDHAGVGRAEEWWRRTLPGRLQFPVPASYNDLFADASVRDHVGDVWYQTVVRVPVRWAGERIMLRFDAATHRAVAWVGDTEVVRHEGGYTPFEADVTDAVELGAENRITVAIDNILNWHSIPPGKVRETPEGAGRAPSTISSTTPVFTGVCGSAPGRSPTSATSLSSRNWPAAPEPSGTK